MNAEWIVLIIITSMVSAEEGIRIYANEGDTVNLTCMVNGTLEATWLVPPRLTIYVIGGAIHTQKYPNFKLHRTENAGNNILQIQNFSRMNEGRYRCQTKLKDFNYEIIIYDKPEVTISPQPSRVLREGQDLTLNCRHDGNDPDARIEWTKNGTKRPLNGNTLKFKGVKRQEAGEYTCEVHTKGWHGDSSIFIEIQYPPNVTIKKRQPDNNTSILECIANGVPNKYFFSKWEHKTEWFDHVRFIEGSNNGYITIQNDPSKENGSYQNSGIYVCNVSNNISDLSGSIHQSAAIDLRLKGRPFFLSGNKQKQYAIYGREGVIQLFLYSNPKYESLTMFCGKQSFRLQSDNTREKYYLAENEGPTLDKIYGSLVNVSAYKISVRINQIRESDFGNHTINATNSWGTAAFTVRLISAHRPEPPFNVSAKPDTNIIRVFWNGGFDGGYSQTFVLQYKKLGVSLQNEWTRFGEINDARQETYSVAIEGLEFDQQYIVCIFAYNEMNSSEIKCTDPVKTDLEKETRTQMTQYSIITLVMIMLGIVFSFQIGITILKGLKGKICKTRRQNSIQLSPQHASEINTQYHYDEIDSVYYGPVQTQGAINTRAAQPENNNNPTRSTILAGLNESINMPGDSHRISNEAQSTDSDDSYLVPCISRTEQSAEDSNNQAESVDGSSVSSDNSETILKNDRRYENLNCVYVTEHPYMPCPQFKANAQ